jgi:hypothetical protein
MLRHSKTLMAAGITAALVVFTADIASANVWQTLQSKASEGFVNTRNLVFLLGGFGIIGLAVMAFFGRFQFKWFAALIGGMVLLAVTGSMIEYVTTDSSGGSITSGKDQFKDTLSTR